MGRRRKKGSLDVKTIKSSLKTILRDEKDIRKVEYILTTANDIRSDTYKFIKAFCLKKLADNEDLPIIDKKLLEYSMNKVLSKQQRNYKVGDKNEDILTNLVIFYEDEFKPNCDHKPNSSAKMSKLIKYVATEMLTNIENNLKQHYFKRLKKYLRNIGGTILDNGDVYYTKEQKGKILNKLIRNIMNFEYDQIDSVFRRWFKKVVKKDIIPNEFQTALSYDCKVDPRKYLVFTINICKAYEIHNKEIEDDIANLEDQYWERYLENKKEIAALRKAEGDKKTIGIEVKVKLKEQRRLKTKSPTFQLNKKKFSLFNAFPASPYGLGYAKLDTAALISWFCKTDKEEMMERSKTDKGEIWNLVFKMDHPIFKGTKNYKFDYMLSTDGVGCSLQFRKVGTTNGWQTKKNLKKAKLAREQNPEPIVETPQVPKVEKPEFRKFEDMPLEYIMKFDNVIFIDPGTKFLIYCMDRFGKFFKFTAAQRRFETGSKVHNQIQEKEKSKKIIATEARLATFSKKSVDYQEYSQYLGYENGYPKDNLRKFYRQKIWRKLRWRRFINNQRSETNLLRKLKETFGYKGKKILIVIGNWSRQEGMKFGEPTLGIGMRRLLAREFPVVLMDEHKTSKVCSGCHGITEDVTIDGNHVHRLLGCKHCNTFTDEQAARVPQAAVNPRCKYMQRDQNACRNFRTIFNYALKFGMKERPPAFRR